MTFRPSPLAYALAVVIAWIICLAIAIDRVELFFTAIPPLVRMLRSPVPAESDVRDFNLATAFGPRLEGEDFVVTACALIEPTPGPIEILPVLPPLLSALTGPSPPQSSLRSRMVALNGTAICIAEQAAYSTSAWCSSGYGTKRGCGSPNPARSSV